MITAIDHLGGNVECWVFIKHSTGEDDSHQTFEEKKAVREAAQEKYMPLIKQHAAQMGGLPCAGDFLVIRDYYEALMYGVQRIDPPTVTLEIVRRVISYSPATCMVIFHTRIHFEPDAFA